jgi:DNA repair ATPase RecN
MAVPILPVLSALSQVASTAWTAYSKIKRAREALPENSAISSRLEALENTSLEQAETLSELSKDLEQFAQAIQAEVEQTKKRQTLLTWISSISLAIGAAAIGLFVFLLLK